MVWGCKTHLAALALVAASLLVYFVGLCALNPYPIADEGGHHLVVIKQLFLGQWSWPDHLPMPPVYHVVACGVCHLFGAELHWLRLLGLVTGLGGAFVFACINGRLNGDASSWRLLHFAWLPILFPYIPLVYTDAMSVACVVAAFCLQLRGCHKWAAVTLILACAVRPSNVIWAAFLAIHAFSSSDHNGPSSADDTSLKAPRHSKSMILVYSTAIVFGLLLIAASIGPWRGQVEANRLRVNVAQLFLFALFIAVGWLPVWIREFPSAANALMTRLRTHRHATILLLLALGAAAVGAVLIYENPHPWNRNDSFLRNVPLGLMEESILLRASVFVIAIAAALTMWHSAVTPSRRRIMVVLSACTVAYLLPHSLAEPRYYILPAVFFNLFADYTKHQTRQLALWYGLLSAAIAAYVCTHGHGSGGIW